MDNDPSRVRAYDLYRVHRNREEVRLELVNEFGHELDALEEAYISDDQGEYVIAIGTQLLARLEVVPAEEKRHLRTLIEEGGTDWARALAQCGPSAN